MTQSKVDPAALLVAVFTVAISQLYGGGVWDVTHTYIAVIVGVVVICFTWPRTDDEGRAPRFDRRIVIAQSVVYGFILGMALAWPVQSLLSDCWLIRTDVTCTAANPTPVHATFIALGAGLLSILGFYLLVRWKVKRLLKPSPKPQGLDQSRSDMRRSGGGGSTGKPLDKWR
jgi:hypothetical protein